MSKTDSKGLKKLRFFKEPTTEEIENYGDTASYLRARQRARILGSRAMSGLVVVGTGTAISVLEIASGSYNGQTSLLTNYGVPLAVNGFAQIKVEKRLRQSGEEILKLLPNAIEGTPDITINNVDE